MKSIMEIAKKHGLYVVEDAAHAPGAEYRRRKCGTLGELGCFSFFSNKNLVTGEGGLIFTRNRAWAEKVRSMRSHGMKALSWDKYRGHLSSYDIDALGYNYRTTEIQSALGLVQLRKMDRNNQKRGKLVEAYRKEFQKMEGISIPFSEWGGRPSYHLFSILVAPSVKREEVMEELRGQGIQTSIHYPPIHLFSLYRKNFGYRKRMLPVTEEVSQRVITLPLHPLMKVTDVKWIAEKVKEVIKKCQ
jgi:dTDP-4-amino-4,6-dideoxygalactose transaminase